MRKRFATGVVLFLCGALTFADTSDKEALSAAKAMVQRFADSWNRADGVSETPSNCVLHLGLVRRAASQVAVESTFRTSDLWLNCRYQAWVLKNPRRFMR